MGLAKLVLATVLYFCALAAIKIYAWPQKPSAEALKKQAIHRERKRNKKGLIDSMNTMTLMMVLTTPAFYSMISLARRLSRLNSDEQVYPKHILAEMHEYWCVEREEKGSPACTHWDDVRNGGWYMSKEKQPPEDEIEQMHARRRRPARAPHAFENARLPRRSSGARKRSLGARPRRSARSTRSAARAKRRSFSAPGRGFERIKMFKIIVHDSSFYSTLRSKLRSRNPSLDIIPLAKFFGRR